MNARLAGILAAMVALLGAGLATGTRVYYALFLLLLLLTLFSLASVLWTLLDVYKRQLHQRGKIGTHVGGRQSKGKAAL